MTAQRILIVDDEPPIVELARLYLEREGFHVESCGTAAAGLASAASLEPDLVVLDLMLPQINGAAVLKIGK